MVLPDLRIVSGGAAHGLVQALTPDFMARTGFGITGDFGAVGGMRKRLIEGEPVDLAILTRAILDELGRMDLIDPASIRDVGGVATAVAVRDGDEPPAIVDGETLAEALLSADAIYFPDPDLATAGIHFRETMRKLGILDRVAAKLRTFPNGATAMRALAVAAEKRPIGCTQATEIVATPGVRLAGDLPGEHALVTVYAAGRSRLARHGAEAETLIALLTSPDAAALRRRCAFVDA